MSVEPSLLPQPAIPASVAVEESPAKDSLAWSVAKKVTYMGLTAAEAAGWITLFGKVAGHSAGQLAQVGVLAGVMSGIRQRLLYGKVTPPSQIKDLEKIGAGDAAQANQVLRGKVGSALMPQVVPWLSDKVMSATSWMWNLVPGYEGWLYKAGLTMGAVGTVGSYMDQDEKTFTNEQIEEKVRKEEEMDSWSTVDRIFDVVSQPFHHPKLCGLGLAGTGLAIAGVRSLFGSDSVNGGVKSTDPGKVADQMSSTWLIPSGINAMAFLGQSAYYVVDSSIEATYCCLTGTPQDKSPDNTAMMLEGTAVSSLSMAASGYINDVPPPATWGDRLAEASWIASKVGGFVALANAPVGLLISGAMMGLMHSAMDRKLLERLTMQATALDLRVMGDTLEEDLDALGKAIAVQEEFIRSAGENEDVRLQAEFGLKSLMEKKEKLLHLRNLLSRETEQTEQKLNLLIRQQGGVQWEQEWQEIHASSVNRVGAATYYALNGVKALWGPYTFAYELASVGYSLGKKKVREVAGTGLVGAAAEAVLGLCTLWRGERFVNGLVSLGQMGQDS